MGLRRAGNDASLGKRTISTLYIPTQLENRPPQVVKVAVETLLDLWPVTTCSPFAERERVGAYAHSALMETLLEAKHSKGLLAGKNGNEVERGNKERK